MAFLEEIGRRLTGAGQGVAQQTKIFTETARLNSAISDGEKKLMALYTALGRAYYGRHKDDPASEDPERMAEISALRTQIVRHKEQIKLIRGLTSCPQCGADVLLSARFCSACGEKMPRPKQRQNLCPHCSAVVADESAFCSNCGVRLKEAPIKEPEPSSEDNDSE